MQYTVTIFVYESTEPIFRFITDSLSERVAQLKSENKLVEHSKTANINIPSIEQTFGILHNAKTQFKQFVENKSTYPYQCITVNGELI